MKTKFDTKLIIDKIINLTKANLKWHYLDTDRSIDSIANEILVDYVIDDNSSFFCQVDSGYFALVQPELDEPDDMPILFLIAVPGSDARDIRILNSYLEHQQDLLRLQNLVKKQYPNVDDFLDSFLKS